MRPTPALTLPCALPALLVLLLTSAAACTSSSDARPRCAQCGMFADAAPQWTARATPATPPADDSDHAGEARLFDSPKCALRYAAAHPQPPLTLTFTEYYTQSARPADTLWFVRGSDLQSPMGADLVPLSDRAAAEAFARDHGGEALPFEAIDAAVLSSLE